MNINFNNNIENPENPLVIVILKSSDLVKNIKITPSLKDLFNNLIKIKNISSLINNAEIGEHEKHKSRRNKYGNQYHWFNI